MKDTSPLDTEARTAVLVDCDNVPPEILEYALLMAAQFGRIVLRRSYGNQSTLSSKWQEAMVRQAFTPCLQHQYVAGKNTADIALALDAQEALFDERVDTLYGRMATAIGSVWPRKRRKPASARGRGRTRQRRRKLDMIRRGAPGE